MRVSNFEVKYSTRVLISAEVESIRNDCAVVAVLNKVIIELIEFWRAPSIGAGVNMESITIKCVWSSDIGR